MPAIETYTEALQYIYSFIRTDRKPAPKWTKTDHVLDHLRAFLQRLGNPHECAPVLLIAGTKGKGSTAAMCERMLRAAGYRTGFYSSPHLHSFRERIRLNGDLVSEAELVRLLNEMRPHIAASPRISAWDLMTSLGFMAFAAAEVDVVVLEVGLGGRTDATNVSQPQVSVITPISYDHVQVLGKTLSRIAFEKAGIIRPQGRAVVAPQFPEAMTVFEAVCAERQATLTVIGDDVRWRVAQASLNQQIVYIDEQRYSLPLLGEHQALNAATAITAVRQFATAADLSLPPEALQNGLARVQWPGRLEILSREPMLLVDSAMNGDSGRRLHQALAHYFYGRNVVLVFGASRDHNYTATLKALLPNTRHIIVTRSRHPKSISPLILSRVAKALGSPVSITTTVDEAMQEALSLVAEDDVICATGSLFCAAEARLAWFRHAEHSLPPIDPL